MAEIKKEMQAEDLLHDIDLFHKDSKKEPEQVIPVYVSFVFWGSKALQNAKEVRDITNSFE